MSEYKLPAYHKLEEVPPEADPAYLEGINIGILQCMIHLKCQGLDVSVLQGGRNDYDGWWATSFKEESE